MKKEYGNGIWYVGGNGFMLSDSRAAELSALMNIDADDLDLRPKSDDRHYIVLTWPELFTDADCFHAVNAAIHQLPVPVPYWSTDRGRMAINKFEKYGHQTIKKIEKGFDEAIKRVV